MDSQKVLYSAGKNDEMYTPKYAVKPILEYIKPDWVVWCPFDTVNSEFVKEISKTNKVIYSHIDNGEDFYTYEPSERWDCIISNPPFSNKRSIFERALSFGKPIALLMANTWLNDKYSKWVFYEAGRDMQLLMFDKRIRYIKPDGTVENKITFSSSYYCSDFLPNAIVLKGLEVETK
jgi:hypothetical protein